jgi:hypothetical protein
MPRCIAPWMAAFGRKRTGLQAAALSLELGVPDRAQPAGPELPTPRSGFRSVSPSTTASYLLYRQRSPARAVCRLWQLALIGYTATTLLVLGDWLTHWWMDRTFILGTAAMLISRQVAAASSYDPGWPLNSAAR